MNPTKALRADLTKIKATHARLVKNYEELKDQHAELIKANIALERASEEMTEGLERFCEGCSERDGALCQGCLLNKWLY